MSGAAEVAWVKRVLGLDALAARSASPTIGTARRAAAASGYAAPPASGDMPRFGSAYGTPDKVAADTPYATLAEVGEMRRPASAYSTPEQSGTYAAAPETGEMPRFASAYGTPEQFATETPYVTPAEGGEMPRPASAYSSPEQSGASAYAAPPENGEMPRPAFAYSEPGAPPAAPPPKRAKTFEPVDTTPTPTGMKAKRVADSYDGEHNQVAWRNWGVAKDNTQITTKLYTDEERAANALQPEANGSYKKGDGSSVAGAELGYAMDASGQMVTFNEGAPTITSTDADGNTTSRPAQGIPDIKATIRADPSARAELPHHSTALGGDVVTDKDGKPVLDNEGRPMMRSRAAASAGMVAFDFFGRIVKINNTSGHYKPQVDYLLQAVEQLTRQGAFFADDITDADGNILQRDDKRLKLFDAVKAKLKHAQTLGERAATLTASLATTEDARDQADLADDLGRLSNEIDKLNGDIEQAQKVLRKLGVAPSQKLRDAAKVEFLDVKPGMSGLQIKTAKPEEMKVNKFLKSGGGNLDALGQKQDVLDEIREGGKRTRKALNAEANARADKVGGSGPAPDADAVEDALAALEGRRAQGGRPKAAPGRQSAAASPAAAPPAKPAAAYADPAELNPEPGQPGPGRPPGAYSEPARPKSE